MLPLGFHSLSEDPQKNLLSRAFISKEFGGLPNGIFFLSFYDENSQRQL